MTVDYDFIVVGSGAGGGPLASRLARHPAGFRVALLEAGSDPKVRNEPDQNQSGENWNYDVPVLHGRATEDPQLSWSFFVQHYKDKSRQRLDSKFYPQPGQPADSDPRHAGIFYPRAAAIGGCTAHNALITIYPHPEDWEYLERLTGDASWSSNSMRSYFERLENCRYSIDPATSRHGTGNWLSTSLIDPRLLFDALHDPQIIAVAAGAVKTAIENALLRLGRSPGDDQLKAAAKQLMVMRDAILASHFQIPHPAAGALGRVEDLLTLTDDKILDFLKTIVPEIGRLHQLAQGTGPFRRFLGPFNIDPVEAVINRMLQGLFGGASLPTILQMIIGHLDPNAWQVVQGGSEGIFAVPMATDGLRRSGPRDFIQETLTEFPDRLDLMQNVLVTKVLFDGTRATGVNLVRGENGYFGSPRNNDRQRNPPSPLPSEETLTLRDGGEVILCGGAFNTPQLLMLSGIGPKQVLDSWHISPLGNRYWNGVGKNLQDRYELAVIAEMRDDFEILVNPKFETPVGTGDDDPGFVEWRDQQQGVYTSNGVLLSYIMRSSQAEHLVAPGQGGSELPPPDLFIFALLGHFKGYEPGYAEKIEQKRNQLTWAILKGHTRNASGEVVLRSLDPRDTPIINFHSFDEAHAEASSDAGKDLDALVEGVAAVKQILDKTGGAVKQITWPPLPIDNLQDEEQHEALKQFILNEAWGHHACGTCRIGSADDPLAVIDGDFRVHGVDGLRIVDASVFPKIPGFFIVSAIYMISEKAADVIPRAHGNLKNVQNI